MTPFLEEYLDFSDPEEIRIQDHRVWLHHVLEEYLRGMTFESLCRRFDTLSKAQILACLLYYHHNQQATDKYMAELREFFRKQREQSEQEHGDWVGELRRRKTPIAAANDRKESA
jgi:uncharacterized protein (DUF433 family)